MRTPPWRGAMPWVGTEVFPRARASDAVWKMELPVASYHLYSNIPTSARRRTPIGREGQVCELVWACLLQEPLRNKLDARALTCRRPLPLRFGLRVLAI